ncbi:MAG: DUF512 domain-containing protein, partial [Ilumatobacteraceae bacterium]
SVDGGGAMPPNPAAYTGLRAESRVELRSAVRRSGSIGILTGELGAAVLAPLIDSLDRSDVRLLPVRNDFFGGNTAVTGLMTFEDVSRVLAGEPETDRYLLPDVCLSDDGRFLDGGRSVDLPRRVEIVPTDGSSLRRALQSAV